MAGCHWRFGLWDCTGICSRSVVFEVVIDTIIRGFVSTRLVYHASAADCVCTRFLNCAVMMLYDLGVLALFLTLTRFHVFRVGFSTRTVCCGDRGASSLAVRSWYDLYPSCRCCRNAFTSPFDRDDTTGRLICIVFR